MSKEIVLLLDSSFTQSSPSFVHEQVESLSSCLLQSLIHIVVFKDYKSLNPIRYCFSTRDSCDILAWIKSHSFTGGGHLRNAILESLLYGLEIVYKSDSPSKHVVLMTNSLSILHGPRLSTNKDMNVKTIQDLGILYKEFGVSLSFISQLKAMKDLEELIDTIQGSPVVNSAPSNAFFTRKIANSLATKEEEDIPMLLLNQKTQIQHNMMMNQSSTTLQIVNPTPMQNINSANPLQNHIWVGYLSWTTSGTESNLNVNSARESKCELYAFPMRPNSPDLELFNVSFWPQVLQLSGTIPLQQEYLQSQVNKFNVPLVRFAALNNSSNVSIHKFGLLTQTLSTRKLVGIARVSGDSGLLLVENGGKLIGFVCFKVGMSVITGVSV